MKGKRVLILFLIVILFIPISSPGGAKRYKKRKANFSYFVYGNKLGTGSYLIEETKNRLIIRSEARYSAQGQAVELSSELILSKTDNRPLYSRIEGKIGKREIRAETKFKKRAAFGVLNYETKRYKRRVNAKGAEVITTPPFPVELERLAKRYDLKKRGRERFFYYDPIYLRVLPCYLELRDEQRIKGIKGKLYRFFFNLGNIGGYLFIDEMGNIYQVSLPMNGLLITRRGYEGRIPIPWEKRRKEVEKNYTEKEVSFPFRNFKLAGTLTIPQVRKEVKKFPAVVLVSGSGPQNRDEDTPIPGPYGMKYGIFRTIAHRLGNNGFVVLRYDDIGVGESGGNAQTVTLNDRIAEVRAAVLYLERLDFVDKLRIGIIGHSEGAIIAPEVAVRDPEVAGIVLMGAPAKPLDYIIFEQSQAMALSELEFRLDLPDLISIEKQVLTGKDWGEINGVPIFLGWFRSHFYHNPLATITRVHCPILILNGALDLQVLPANAVALALALEKAGRRNYTLRIFDGLDHLFMRNRYRGHLGDYNDLERNISPEVIATIVSWLKENLKQEE